MYTSAVVTLSDKGSIGEREDLSGKKIIEVLKQYGYTVKDYTILPDDIETIKK
ncbi:MAG: molybdopterin-binding protein [Lachnospirales bacterium]